MTSEAEVAREQGGGGGSRNGGNGGQHQSRLDMASMVDGAIDRIKREVALQREKSNSMCRLRTAHNWAEDKERVGKFQIQKLKIKTVA